MRLELPTHAFDHGDHGALGSAVERGTRMGHEPGHGGGVDDVPALAVSHDARQHGEDAVDDAGEVDAEHPVRVGECGDLGGADDPDPGGCRYDVNPGETRLVG